MAFPLMRLAEKCHRNKEQQYVPDRCRTAMYSSDLGLGGDPFYKVEVVGWGVMKRVSLVTLIG